MRTVDVDSAATRLAAQLDGMQHVGVRRRAEIEAQLAADGRYTQTHDELVAGAKLAWRNHARCNGRLHWRTLRVRDCRDADTVDEIFEQCVEHLVDSTNGGALRALISVFAPQVDGAGWTVLNRQLVGYAGYRRRGGTIVGDPLNAQDTDRARQLGWSSPGTEFDVLPLLIRDPRGRVHVRELPPEAVLEVPITHPDHPEFAELGLRWHANPAVSNMTLAIGDIDYQLAPFSGWYVSSEIGARDLSDVDRYDKLPAVAAVLGLETRREESLWRDRAVVELTYAVQHSFTAAGVHIVDHHTVARQFLTHVEREQRAGRETPSDWSWINPPISASTTPTFHRLYAPDEPSLRPNFVAKDSGGASHCPVSG